jgi:hypothetical protein
MIWATILQQNVPPEARESVDYGFPQLPGRGDHIQIVNKRGLIDLMQVLYVQYTPTHQPDQSNVLRPAVHLICELIGEYPAVASKN